MEDSKEAPKRLSSRYGPVKKLMRGGCSQNLEVAFGTHQTFPGLSFLQLGDAGSTRFESELSLVSQISSQRLYDDQSVVSC